MVIDSMTAVKLTTSLALKWACTQHSTRNKCHYVKQSLEFKKIPMCRECSCFSKQCPSNIYPLNIPPVVCQTKHPAISAWFHLTLSVWKQTFPLQHDVVSTPGSFIRRFCFNPHGAPDGRGLLRGDCWENGDHIKVYYWILFSFLQLLVVSQSHPTGTCID